MGRQTDEEILQQNLSKVYESKICTFTVAKFQSIEQDNYHCITCTKESNNPYIVCFSCYACYRMHNIIKLRKSKCICQCGCEYYEHSIQAKTNTNQENNENPIDTIKKTQLCKVTVTFITSPPQRSDSKLDMLLKQVYLSKFLPFPYDIVKDILSYLNGFDLTKLQRVNKTARTLVSMDQDLWRRAYGKDFGRSTSYLSKHMRDRIKKKLPSVEKSAREGTITWQEAYKTRIQWRLCDKCYEILKYDNKAKCGQTGNPHKTQLVYHNFIIAYKKSK